MELDLEMDKKQKLERELTSKSGYLTEGTNLLLISGYQEYATTGFLANQRLHTELDRP